MVILLLFLQLSFSFAFSQTLAAPPPPKGCMETCGDFNAPYPFGFKEGCYKDSRYKLTCNSTGPVLGSLKMVKIAVGDGEMHLENWVASYCYNETGAPLQNWDTWISLGNQKSPFTFSNKSTFTAVGCNTIGWLQGTDGLDFTTGCLSYCPNREQVRDDSCSGIGCCQTQIPKGMKRLEFSLSAANDSHVYNGSCSYAFAGVKDNFHFSREDLQYPGGRFIDRVTKTVPIVIDWTIGNGTCEDAKKNSTAYQCRQNSDCVDNVNAGGHFCRCSQGYEGNPYLDDGCQDVDECANSEANVCVEHACKNTVGNYTCACPDGFYGDGTKEGTRCTQTMKAFPVIQLILGIGLGLVFLLVLGSWSYWALKKRRLIRLREKFFKQNGGLLLQQQLSSHEGVTETTKIFSVEELKKATNNFNENQILGKGGYGTVYKGILSDHRVVAIKKSKVVDETQIEQFINEVSILTQINHRNVVKLLGCCLETEVPLLVYEYIPNGTLFQHIHGGDGNSSLSWENRLRIAVETAEALAYLHSSASIPIFHRDVKSANILLDDNYTAKVSDFGASRLVPMDKNQLTTLVQGTFGYLDPEYLHTSQLSDKSNVYSFGVVLVELLTGQLPLSFNRPEDERNLSAYFISSMQNNGLFDILDARVMNEGAVEELEVVAKIAVSCLQVKGDERPSMKEVASELQGLRRLEKHPWVLQNSEETESLLGEASHCFIDVTNGYDSLRNQELLGLEIPR